MRVRSTDETGKAVDVFICRLSELRIVDVNTVITLYNHNLPYGATLFVENGSMVKKGDVVCEWDQYNAVIISEYDGKVSFESVIDGVTYREEADEKTGFREKVIIETRDKTKNRLLRLAIITGKSKKNKTLP